MNPVPYIIFQGNCREALTRYAEIFGAEITMMMTGEEMPAIEIPADKADWIMHSELNFGDGSIMASDDMMGDTPAMAGSSIMMQLPSLQAAQNAFEALSEGGTITMNFGQTPWSEGFGMVTDRFGTSWMISAPDQTS